MPLHPIDPNQTIPTKHAIHAKSSTNANQHLEEQQHTTEAQSTDQINFSNVQEDHQTIQNAAKEIPDIRQEKVEQLKQSIEEGNYQVSSEDLADRLIHDTIINHTSD